MKDEEKDAAVKEVHGTVSQLRALLKQQEEQFKTDRETIESSLRTVIEQEYEQRQQEQDSSNKVGAGRAGS